MLPPGFLSSRLGRVFQFFSAVSHSHVSFCPSTAFCQQYSLLLLLVCPPLSLVIFLPCHLSFLSYAQKPNRSLLCVGIPSLPGSSESNRCPCRGFGWTLDLYPAATNPGLSLFFKSSKMDFRQNQVCWRLTLSSWTQATLAPKFSKNAKLISLTTGGEKDYAAGTEHCLRWRWHGFP